jgi:hypothetical protein
LYFVDCYYESEAWYLMLFDEDYLFMKMILFIVIMVKKIKLNGHRAYKHLKLCFVLNVDTWEDFVHAHINNFDLGNRKVMTLLHK